MAKRERMQRREGEGGRQISALLNAAEAKLLKKHEAAHGGVKAALVAGLRALEGVKEPSSAELVSMIERRLK